VDDALPGGNIDIAGAGFGLPYRRSGAAPWAGRTWIGVSVQSRVLRFTASSCGATPSTTGWTNCGSPCPTPRRWPPGEAGIGRQPARARRYLFVRRAERPGLGRVTRFSTERVSSVSFTQGVSGVAF
jgi:hypothetical protein